MSFLHFQKNIFYEPNEIVISGLVFLHGKAWHGQAWLLRDIHYFSTLNDHISPPLTCTYLLRDSSVKFSVPKWKSEEVNYPADMNPSKKFAFKLFFDNWLEWSLMVNFKNRRSMFVCYTINFSLCRGIIELPLLSQMILGKKDSPAHPTIF